MPRPKAKTGTKARGKSRVKVRKRKKPIKTPKAKTRRKTRRPGKITPEGLRKELIKLRRSVSALLKTLADVPDKKVIIRGTKDLGPIAGCRKPQPGVITQPLNEQCLYIGRSVKAIVFKRCLGGVALTIDFLIQIIEIEIVGFATRRRRGK